MQVGDVLALICKHTCHNDDCLMERSIDSIDIKDEGIYLYFTDANTEDYMIKTENE